ncbi:MAG: 30S ribosomal protein S17e [Nanoarchaeota archaeon]
MGKIKNRLVKRTAETLVEKELPFKEDFDDNKKVLSNRMPSKKIRNQIAGYVTRLKKNELKKLKQLESN